MTQELAPVASQPAAYLQAIDARLTQIARHNQQINLQMVGMLRDMAGQMHAMSDQLADVTRQLADQAQRMPLNPQQRTALARAIRERAGCLAAEYNVAGSRRINQICAAIRADIRKHISSACGLNIRAMGDVPACQFPVVMQLVAMWDELLILDSIRREGTV